MRRLILVAGPVAVALAVAIAGCAPVLNRAELTVLNAAEPETLDPAQITGQPEGRIALALFEGLTAFDEFGKTVQGVAERWDISPDGRVYTFHLRPDACWSDGSSVTSEDFIASWRRTLEPETASGYAYMLHPIAGAKAFNEGTLSDFSQVGLHAPDSRTLEVTLDYPTPYFLDLCAFVTLAPVHSQARGTLDGQWMRPGRLISNGAYRLDLWRVNDRVRLSRNPWYWNRDAVAMDTVDIFPTSNATTAFNLYHTGTADLMLDKNLTPVSLLDELRKRQDFHSAPFLATFFLRFNATRPPFNDPRVRKAFSHAIDRERIVERITRAGEEPASSFTPPGAGGYAPPSGPQLDLKAARALLAEAGYPGGAGFPRVTYLYNSSELQDYIAVEIKEMLRATLGIDLVLRNIEWKVYLNAMDQLEYDICRSSWVGDYNDPNTFLDCFVTDGGNNRTGWSNARYDELIAAAAREVDPQRRHDIFREAERLLVSEQAAIAPVYHFVGVQFYDRTRLGGMEANLLDEHPIRRMFWRDDPAAIGSGNDMQD